MKSFYPHLFKFVINLWPCIRGAGGRVTFVRPDFTQLKVKIPLNWRTRNRVGSIYGGSIYGATDPFFMIMLMEILGKGYVVWDKGATIRFKRPAFDTLFTEFNITPERLQEVKSAIDLKCEGTFTWTIQLRDKAGVVYAEIDKIVYVATKEFYKQKLKRKQSNLL